MSSQPSPGPRRLPRIPAPAARNGFDKLARPYRWLEYLTFGPLLARTRLTFLDALPRHGTALVLGDGDGRFTARLLARHPQLHVEVVDSSQAMLGAMTRNTTSAHFTASSRLTLHCADARTYTPTRPPAAIVTHFFLDCLPDPDTCALAARFAALLPPGAPWLVSEFRIPPGPARGPARLLVRALYLAFRLLTGLRTTHLPDYPAAFTAAGLTRTAVRHRLFGILTAELWQKLPHSLPVNYPQP